MTPRAVAAAGAVAGAATAVGPLLGWFRFRPSGGEVAVSGLDASGALWVVALLGVVAAGLAAAFVRRPLPEAARVVGGALTALGAAAAAWSAWVAGRASVELTAGSGSDRIVFDLRPHLLWPAVATPAAAAAVAVAGLLIARPRVRWPW
ncbi:MAG: hypothetical protein IT200_01435 [Thermoleophilia bacterium]|nr:hypothetical protein [Thermoleophilia bacterium]